MFERLDAAFKLTLHKLPVAALILLTVWLPANLAHSYFSIEVWGIESMQPSLIFATLIVLLLDPLSAGALLFLFNETLSGRRCGYGRAMAFGLSRWGLLIAARVVVQVLVGLGTLAFILPGLYLLARWALVECAVVFEGAVPSVARRRSAELTAGRMVEVFLAWHLPVLAFFGLSWYGERLLAATLDANWVASGLWDSAWSLVQIFVVAVLFLYYRLGVSEEAAEPVAEGGEA